MGLIRELGPAGDSDSFPIPGPFSLFPQAHSDVPKTDR